MTTIAPTPLTGDRPAADQRQGITGLRPTRRRRLRHAATALAAAVTMTGALMCPAAASAAGGGLATAVGERLEYIAAAGDANSVVVAGSLSYWVGDFVHTYVVVDDTKSIRAGAGCAHLSPNDSTMVQCHLVVPRYGVSLVIIRGGDGNDIIRNSAASHVDMVHMYGGPGDDRLYGDVRNDRLWGDSGSDRLYAGPGSDGVYGGSGNDIMYAGAGEDRSYGNTGNDTIDGGTGIDFMSGGDGVDTMSGRAGNDDMYGNAGNETLYGNEDRDSLDGGTGSNRLNGGAPDTAPGDRCVNGPTMSQCNP
jgi:Ca2+-binding RTX toxin-like protein